MYVFDFSTKHAKKCIGFPFPFPSHSAWFLAAQYDFQHMQQSEDITGYLISDSMLHKPHLAPKEKRARAKEPFPNNYPAINYFFPFYNANISLIKFQPNYTPPKVSAQFTHFWKESCAKPKYTPTSRNTNGSSGTIGGETLQAPYVLQEILVTRLNRPNYAAIVLTRANNAKECGKDTMKITYQEQTPGKTTPWTTGRLKNDVPGAIRQMNKFPWRVADPQGISNWTHMDTLLFFCVVDIG